MVTHNIINHNLRNSSDLRNIHARTEKFRNSVIVKGIKMWNDMDSSLKEIQCYDLLKNVLNVQSKQIIYFVGLIGNQISFTVSLECSVVI